MIKDLIVISVCNITYDAFSKLDYLKESLDIQNSHTKIIITSYYTLIYTNQTSFLICVTDKVVISLIDILQFFKSIQNLYMFTLHSTNSNMLYSIVPTNASYTHETNLDFKVIPNLYNDLLNKKTLIILDTNVSILCSIYNINFIHINIQSKNVKDIFNLFNQA